MGTESSRGRNWEFFTKRFFFGSKKRPSGGFVLFNHRNGWRPPFSSRTVFFCCFFPVTNRWPVSAVTRRNVSAVEVEDLQAEHICAILKTDPHRGATEVFFEVQGQVSAGIQQEFNIAAQNEVLESCKYWLIKNNLKIVQVTKQVLLLEEARGKRLKVHWHRPDPSNLKLHHCASVNWHDPFDDKSPRVVNGLVSKQGVKPEVSKSSFSGSYTLQSDTIRVHLALIIIFAYFPSFFLSRLPFQGIQVDPWTWISSGRSLRGQGAGTLEEGAAAVLDSGSMTNWFAWGTLWQLSMGVSIDGGTSKWMVYKGKSYEIWWLRGTPVCGTLRIATENHNV